MGPWINTTYFNFAWIRKIDKVLPSNHTNIWYIQILGGIVSIIHHKFYGCSFTNKINLDTYFYHD